MSLKSRKKQYKNRAGCEAIHRNVVDLCKKTGIPVYELEVKANIGTGVIGHWYEHYPRVDSLMRIARYFGVTLDTLVAGAEVEEQQE